jgi:hypothetical protein
MHVKFKWKAEVTSISDRVVSWFPIVFRAVPQTLTPSGSFLALSVPAEFLPRKLRFLGNLKNEFCGDKNSERNLQRKKNSKNAFCNLAVRLVLMNEKTENLF